VIAPRANGTCSGVFFVLAAASLALSAGSEPAKSIVPQVRCAIPAPEPTPWYLTVRP
jgi:hypothetical protein